MPKISSITKEMVLNSAFEIVRLKGFNALSARSISQYIGCSTQPIYWIYKNMELLKQDVIKKIVDFLNNEIIVFHKSVNSFLDIGLGYIHVAHTEPVLFKAIYVNNILGIKLIDIIPNEMMVNAIKNDIGMTNTSDANLEEVVVKGWIFAHGIASLVATGMMVYDKEKIEKLLLSFME